MSRARVNWLQGPPVTLMCKGFSVKLRGQFQTWIKDSMCP